MQEQTPSLHEPRTQSIASTTATDLTREPAPSNADATSALLHALRALAAQAVVVGHALNFADIGAQFRPPNAIYMQNLAVVVFFCMSGYVIAMSIQARLARGTYEFPEFALDRLVRFLVTLVPSLAFIWALDQLTAGTLAYAAYESAAGMRQFIGNLLMLQSYPGSGILPFGTARPLWSIGLEWWCYMVFGFLLIAPRSRSIAGIILGLAAFALGLRLVLPNFLDARGLALAWIIGAVGFHAVSRIPPMNRSAFVAMLMAILLVLPALWRQIMTMGAGYSVNASLATSLLVVAAIFFVANWRLRVPLAVHAVARFFADYSFTLYCVHYSVLFALVTHSGLGGVGLFLTGILASNVAALAIASVSEFRYRAIRRWIKSRFATARA